MNRKKYWRRGSALPMMMMFIAVMTVGGVGLLSVAQNMAVRATATVEMDKQFYSAESAAQLAIQMFTKKLQDDDLYLIRENIDTSSFETITMAEMKDELEGKLADKLEDITTKMIADMEGTEFNDEPVTLESIELRDFDFGGEPYPVIMDDTKTTSLANNAIVYLKDPEFVLSAKSGTRTVTTVVSYTIRMKPETEDVEFDFVEYGNGGAYYEDESGGIYKSGNEGMYEMFIDGLQDLVNYTNHGISKESVLKLGTGETTDNWEVVTNGAASSFAGKSRVKYTGSQNLSGTYPDVEYLDVPGNLTIATASFPKLKGVYVGGSLNIREGSTVTGSRAYGTNFLVKSSATYGLTVTARAAVDWCRFYVQGSSIHIPISGNVELISNSIFVATKGGNSNAGKIIFDGQNNRMQPSHSRVPQFYAENDININLQNSNAEIRGIFMTLSDNPVFTGKPTQTLDSGFMQGLFVGNCSNSAGIPNGSTVVGFTDTQQSMMMSGGVYDILNDIDISQPQWAEVVTDMTVEKDTSGLTIRETTGEN